MKAGKDYIGVGVGAIIANDKQQILLQKRSASIIADRTTAGMWSTAGGEVKFGERLVDALKREVKEELGIGVEIVRYIGYHDQTLSQACVHWNCHSFLCKIKKGTPKIQENEKFDKLGWFSINTLPENCGIAHIVSPLYKLGWISKEEYTRRVRNTPES